MGRRQQIVTLDAGDLAVDEPLESADPVVVVHHEVARLEVAVASLGASDGTGARPTM